MSIGEIVRYLADPAKLGAIAFVVMAIAKKLWPALADDWAWALSVVVAALVAVVAILLGPKIPALPPEVLAVWPVIVWAVSQIIHKLAKWAGLEAAIAKLSWKRPSRS